jgi:hypothetical protein
MLDGVQVSWAVWLRHALDLDHIDTLEARAADGIVEAADLLERLAQTVKDLTAEKDDAWRICATWRERAHAAEAKEIPEGHVAVPREPTEAMLQEGYEAAAPLQEIKRAPQVLMFKAMLTAAEGESE